MKHILLTGFTSKVEDDTVYLYYQHNDNGYLYVSYEDVNIYSTLMGILKSASETDYKYIYQYDEYGCLLSLSFSDDTVYLANTYEKETSETEYLTQVAITVSETTTCSVYVNPTGTSLDSEDLYLVELASGESETFDAGYHTLEFSYPVELTGDSFAIVIKSSAEDGESSIGMGVEFNYPEYYEEIYGKELSSGSVVSMYGNVEISKNCYYTSESKFSSNEWENLGELSTSNSSLPDCDSTIKAFTITEYDGETLNLSNTSDSDDTSGDTSDEESSSTLPVNSDFSSSSCVINSLKYYTFSDDTEEYKIINVTVEDVTRYTSDNDDYEYYYYLSSSQSETDIEDWIEITETQTSSSSLTFDIKTTDQSNYSELASAENIYLYIKEVAIKDENSSTLIADPLLLTTDTETDITIELYLDGELYYDSTTNSSTESTSATSTSSESSTSSSDDTTSTSSLPYTRKNKIYHCNINICPCYDWTSKL